MAQQTISVGILGLGRIGRSVGLALKRYNTTKNAQQAFVVTGFDSRDILSSSAMQAKAVDHVSRSVIGAVEDKDIVVFALAASELPAAYRNVAGEIRVGGVLLDLSTYALPSLELAKKHLKAETHLVSMTPVLNPKYLFDGLDDEDHASEDLFDRGAFLIAPAVNTESEAVELAVGFAEIVGAAGVFVDPAEHDGWMASLESLPAILGLGTFASMTERDGWQDSRKAANASFGRLTHHLHDTHPDDLRDFLLNNRTNAVNALDHAIASFQTIRDILVNNDQLALEELIIRNSTAYEKWVNERNKGQWDSPNKSQDSQSVGDIAMRGMFGGFLAKKLKGGKDDKK